MATANRAEKACYASQIMRDCAVAPPTVVWDAVEASFPSILSVDALLIILARINVTDRDGGIGTPWLNLKLFERIAHAGDLERLLVGLLALIGPEPDDDQPSRNKREETLLTAIGSAASSLLARTRLDAASSATIDAAIRIGRHTRFGRGSLWDNVGDVGAESVRALLRRRLAFWRAAEIIRGHRYLRGHPLRYIWQIETLGWLSGLMLEDIDWLLADGLTREFEDERKLAVNAALQIWTNAGKPDGVHDRIQRVAAADPSMREAHNEWTRPRVPDPAQAEYERQIRELQEKSAIARAEQDQSWRDFIGTLRANPDQLRHLNPSKGINPHLYHAWALLHWVAHGQGRYAIASVSPVESILGTELAGALRDGLIRHWRSWEPRRKSACPAEQRNSVRHSDVMGITGVSLEAATSPEWVDRLDPDLARRATAYATLELNGFPKWMSEVSARWPTEVAFVLREEVVADLEVTDANLSVLSDIGQADDRTLAAVVPSLLDELERRPDIPAVALSELLTALARAPGEFGPSTSQHKSRSDALCPRQMPGSQVST